MSKPDYDTTLARMAGNIAGSMVSSEQLAALQHADPYIRRQWVAQVSVLAVEFACTIQDILRDKSASEGSRETPETEAQREEP